MEFGCIQLILVKIVVDENINVPLEDKSNENQIFFYGIRALRFLYSPLFRDVNFLYPKGIIYIF